MGSERKTSDYSSFISARVDATAVYDSVLKVIYSMRSSDPLQPGRIVDRADENLSATDGESLLNTLYRLIGLPAVRKETALDSSVTDAQKSQDGSINYMSLASAGISAAQLNQIEDREKELSSRRPLDTPPAPSAQNILRGTLAMIDPIRPADSVSDAKNSRRPSILPMVVCGDVPVFPIENRTAPLFYAGGNFQNNIKQHRPFIEFIILSRLSPIDSGEMTTALIESLNSMLDDVAKSNETAAGVDPSKLNPVLDQLKADLGNQNLITLRIIQKLYQSLIQCAEDYQKTTLMVQDYLRHVSYVPVLNGRAPSVLQGHFNISYAEQIEKLKAAGAEGVLVAERLSKEPPYIDMALANLELAISESVSLLIPVSGYSASANSILNNYLDSMSGNQQAANAPTDTFEDIIVQIATVDRDALSSEQEELQQRAKGMRSSLERLREKMNVYTGETIGFSIFDFLAIMIALYTVDAIDLAGLLNTEARERLLQYQDIKASLDATGQTNRINSPDAAIKKLQDKVKEILSFADAAYDGSLVSIK